MRERLLFSHFLSTTTTTANSRRKSVCILSFIILYWEGDHYWKCVTIDRLWISKRSINRQLLRSLLFYSDEKKKKKKKEREKKKKDDFRFSSTNHHHHHQRQQHLLLSLSLSLHNSWVCQCSFSLFLSLAACLIVVVLLHERCGVSL
jgi:hypothetical protein